MGILGWFVCAVFVLGSLWIAAWVALGLFIDWMESVTDDSDRW